MAKTQHDILCKGLQGIGAKQIPSRNKYTMFERYNDVGVRRFYFIGRNGALRFATRANAALSIPVSDQFRQRVIAAAENPEPIKIKL